MAIEKNNPARERKDPTILNMRLQQLREGRNETQQDIANVLGLKGNKIISWYETTGAMPSYERLIILAKHFDVSLDYLFGINDVKPILKHIDAKANDLATLPLTNRGVKFLKDYSKNKSMQNNDRLKTINKLLEDPILLDNISNILNYKK